MATLDLQVGASADDCRVTVANTSSPPHTWTGISTTVGSYVAGELISTLYGAGARFLNVTVLGTDTIDVAYKTLTGLATRTGQVVRTNLYGEDADNAATFSTVDNFNARAQTAAVVWDNIASEAGNVEYNSPSLVTPITTIKNRAGWVSGNAIAIHWEDNGSDDEAVRSGQSYDFDTTKAPKLHIEYTAGGGAAFVPTLIIV